MAVIQQIHGDYSTSENTVTEAIPLFQKKTKSEYKIAVYNRRGINYERLYDYDNTVLYYNKALNLTEDELEKAILKNNIAVTYILQNSTKSSTIIIS